MEHRAPQESTVVKDLYGIRKYWRRDGKKHSDGQPAVIILLPNGARVEKWYHNGEKHRVDGPAVIKYRSNGTKEYEYWYQAGESHRDDGPAVIWYNSNGTVFGQSWCRNGAFCIQPVQPKPDPIAEQLAAIEAAVAKIREELAKK